MTRSRSSSNGAAPPIPTSTIDNESEHTNGGPRRHLHPARRPAACHRARSRAAADHADHRARGRARRPLPTAQPWRPHCASPPTNAARSRRLELRPLVRRRAARLRPSLGLQRGLRRCRARAVCADDDITGDDVAELVTRLADKSLITVERDEFEGYLRFRMLQTLVDYGRERLEMSGEARTCATPRTCTTTPTSPFAVWRRCRARSSAAGFAPSPPIWPTCASALDVSVRRRRRRDAQGIAGCLGWYWWFTGRATRRLTMARARAQLSGTGAEHHAGAPSGVDGVHARARFRTLGRARRGRPAGTTTVSRNCSSTTRSKRSAQKRSRATAKRVRSPSSPASRRRSRSRTRRAVITREPLSYSRTPSSCSRPSNPRRARTAMHAFVVARRAFVEDRYADAEKAFE